MRNHSIIDFHTHTFPDKVAEKAVQKLRRSSRIRPFSDGTTEGLRQKAAEAGISLSVILPVATSPKQVEHINNGAILRNQEEAERFGSDLEEPGAGTASRLLSFGCIHPEYPDYAAELRRIAEAGVPGIKLHAYFQGCDMDDIRMLRILDACAENGLIVAAHAGYDQGFPGQHNCTVPMLRSVMRQVKGLTMIAAHMGGWKEWEQVPELLADTGIYLDTSFAVGHVEPDDGEEKYWDVGHFEPDPGMKTCRQKASEEEMAAFRETASRRSVFGSTELLSPEWFARIVRAFPAEHIVFATDSPWSDAETAIAFIRHTDLTDGQKDDILGRTAARLLQIQRQ